MKTVEKTNLRVHTILIRLYSSTQLLLRLTSALTETFSISWTNKRPSYLILALLAAASTVFYSRSLCFPSPDLFCTYRLWFERKLSHLDSSLMFNSFFRAFHFISDEVAVDKRTSLVFSVKSLLYFFIHFLRTQLSDTLHLLYIV